MRVAPPMKVDFGRTAHDYARHRAGFPDSMFVRLAAMGAGTAGQRVVDVGTGTGAVARGFARLGCSVIGIDPSTDLLREARSLSATAGVEVDYREGRAERTGLEDGSMDVYAAGQCWHWFDRPAAAREALRVLTAGGRVVICHFDWLAITGNVVDATEELVRRYNPKPPGPAGGGIYPQWTVDLAEAGFVDIETFSYDVVVAYSHDAWRGRMRASAAVGASLPDDEVERFDSALGRLLAERFPEEPLEVPHRAWAVVARRPQTL